MQNVSLNFSLCRDSVRDKMLRPLLLRAVEFLVEQIGHTKLEAVILTGSLARAESSVVLRRDNFQLLGDIEFLVILRVPLDWPQIRREMVELSRRSTREIGQDGFMAKIEYQPAGLEYLRRNIRPSIFAYDLLNHGKVVWGVPDILQLMKRFRVEDIPQENAIELLMNRLVELIVHKNATEKGFFDREAHGYQLAKVTLDLAGSALAFVGQHEPSYAKREEAFSGLLAADSELSATLSPQEIFRRNLHLATRCKLVPTGEDLRSMSMLAREAPTITDWATDLWLWEMRQLFQRPTASFRDLLEAYVQRERVPQRVKGWLKYFFHPLRPANALPTLRTGRLLLRASPQTLIYAAALLANQGLGQGQSHFLTEAAALLPVANVPENEAVFGQVSDVWHWLIRNN